MPNNLLLDIIIAILGIALSPFPIVATTLVLGSTHARSRGPAFAVGWVAGLSLLMVLVYAVAVSSAANAHYIYEPTNWVKVGLGIVLLLLAAKKWFGRRSADEDLKMPSWMRSIDSLSIMKAGLFGAGLGGINPKSFAFGLLAVTAILETYLQPRAELTAIVLFILLSSSSVLGLVLFYLIKTDDATAILQKIKTFMIKNNDMILMVMYLAIGLALIIKGWSGS